MLYTHLLVFVLAGIGRASPVADPRPVITPFAAPILAREELGTAIGGANDPAATPAPFVADGVFAAAAVEAPPKYLTISIINKHGSPISTQHFLAKGSPNIVSGGSSWGVMAAGTTKAFAVPTSWAGNVAIVDAGHAITGDDSLIEANFNVPPGSAYAVVDVDVSYVNGWSLPIICSCNGVIVTGCRHNLEELHSCPQKSADGGACINPLRADIGATSATTFFKPCSGYAYTFPHDDRANSFGECQSGHIRCCVGSKC